MAEKKEVTQEAEQGVKLPWLDITAILATPDWHGLPEEDWERRPPNWVDRPVGAHNEPLARAAWIAALEAYAEGTLEREEIEPTAQALWEHALADLERSYHALAAKLEREAAAVQPEIDRLQAEVEALETRYARLEQLPVDERDDEISPKRIVRHRTYEELRAAQKALREAQQRRNKLIQQAAGARNGASERIRNLRDGGLPQYRSGALRMIPEGPNVFMP